MRGIRRVGRKRSCRDQVEVINRGICGVTEKKRSVGGGNRTRHHGTSEVVYVALTGEKCEEWDRLVQNPFLAFYQRWPWFAHNTPLLNLWTHTQRHSGRFIVFFLLRSI